MKNRKDISYVIGVVLGDGCIYINTEDKKHHMYQLSITSSDYDICLNCKKIIEEYFGIKSKVKIVYKEKKISYYQMVCCNKKICKFFNRVTRSRAIVPKLKNFIDRKMICVGLMDSDGWISKVNASDGYLRYRVGFKNTNKELTSYLKKNLEIEGVRCGKIQKRKNTRLGIKNKDSYGIVINTLDYCSKIGFNIERKNCLLKEFFIFKKGLSNV